MRAVSWWACTAKTVSGSVGKTLRNSRKQWDAQICEWRWLIPCKSARITRRLNCGVLHVAVHGASSHEKLALLGELVTVWGGHHMSNQTHTNLTSHTSTHPCYWTPTGTCFQTYLSLYHHHWHEYWFWFWTIDLEITDLAVWPVSVLTGLFEVWFFLQDVIAWFFLQDVIAPFNHLLLLSF